MKKVLVAGGLGYIGSHTVLELVKEGYEPIIVDNLANSSISVLESLNKLTNRDLIFHKIDILDYEKISEVFEEYEFDSIINFAGLKAVGESCQKPLLYYHDNLLIHLNLLKLAEKHNVTNILFSSSATVYGEKPLSEIPLVETSSLGNTTNPYGETKKINERISCDFVKANPKHKVALLRYFNPIGADKSGLIGELPVGTPNNLMPYLLDVLFHKREVLTVFGDDYKTPDGTCLRDYIHVSDLARAHVLMLNYMFKKDQNLFVYNIGTGVPSSVLDLINKMHKATGLLVNYQIGARRDGDLAVCYADPSLAFKDLGFKAQYNLFDMCLDSYNFRKAYEERK